MIRKLSLALALFSAGCAGMKYTVNGVEHTVGEKEAPAAAPQGSAAPAAEAAKPADPGAPVVLPAAVLTLPDQLQDPPVLRGALGAGRTVASRHFSGYVRSANPDFVIHLPREYTNLHIDVLGLKSASLRFVRVDALNHPGHNPEDQGSPAGRGDFAVWIETPAGATGAWTVVAQDSSSHPDPSVTYGAPADGAPLEDRELARFSPYFLRSGVGNPSPWTAQVARALFASLPRSFFVFAAQPLHSYSGHEAGPEPLTDEPLLLENRGYVLTSDGVTYEAKAADLTTQPPAKVALPALRKLHITPARQKSDSFEEEDFVALVTDADKADLARYQAAKKSASECYDREWDKRDPDHNASHYDVTTYNKAGEIVKVERMSAKLDREVSAKCKLEVVWKQRDLLEARVLGKYETQRAAWKAESEKHLAEVGFAR